MATIIVAIFLIILVKIVESLVTSIVAGSPGLWPIAYAPEIFGLILALFLLGWSIRPAWLLRPRPTQGAAA